MFGFSEEINKLIVTGVAAGYKEYGYERKRKSDSMIISDGYVFMKSHHIQDQVAKHTGAKLHFKKTKAGPTWRYLEFFNEEKNHLFLFMDEKYFDKNKVINGKTIDGSSNSKAKKYLIPLMDINRGINISADNPEIKGQDVQLSLNFNFEDEVEISNKIKRMFYIVTYNIDINTMMLDAIKVWLPIPENHTAILVDDLTKILKIVQSDHPDYEITDCERLILSNEEVHEQDVPDAVFDFDYDIDVEEESEEF